MGQEVMNRKASMSVNIFIALWFAGIGGHIAEAGWLRDGAVLTGEVMVVVWIAGVLCCRAGDTSRWSFCRDI